VLAGNADPGSGHEQHATWDDGGPDDVGEIDEGDHPPADHDPA